MSSPNGRGPSDGAAPRSTWSPPPSELDNVATVRDFVRLWREEEAATPRDVPVAPDPAAARTGLSDPAHGVPPAFVKPLGPPPPGATLPPWATPAPAPLPTMPAPTPAPSRRISVPIELRRRNADPTQRIEGALDLAMPARGPIRDYVTWATGTTDTPPAFHLASILPSFATETLRRGWTTNGRIHNIWCALVAGPAIGKTTAMMLAHHFVQDWLTLANGADYQDPFLSFEGSLPGVISELMERETPDGSFATLYHPEFARVLRWEEALEVLCTMYDAGKIERNLVYLQRRKAEKKDAGEDGESVKTRLEKPRLSAIVTMTHGSLEEVYREAMLAGGLGSRLLWFTGAVTAEKLMPRQRDDVDGRQRALAVARTWSRTLDGLERTHKSFGHRLTVKLNDAADDVFIDFFDSLRRTIVEDTEIGGIAKRASNYAERIAGVYALSQGEAVITEDTARRAVRLVQLSLDSVGAIRPALRSDVDTRLAEKMYQAIRLTTKTGMTKTEIAKAFQVAKQKRDAALEILTASARVQEITIATKGRPSTRFYAAEHAPLSFIAPVN